MSALHNSSDTVKILLLTAEDCHFCAQGKDTLDRLGREFPLEVEEVALESERGQKLAVESGVLFPPGLFFEGALVGFGRVSERKLRKLLRQRRVDTPAVMEEAG